MNSTMLKPAQLQYLTEVLGIETVLLPAVGSSRAIAAEAPVSGQVAAVAPASRQEQVRREEPLIDTTAKPDVVFWSTSKEAQGSKEMAQRIAAAMKLKFEQFEIVFGDRGAATGSDGIVEVIERYQPRALVIFSGEFSAPEQIEETWVLKTHTLEKLIADPSLKKSTWTGLQELSKRAGL